MEDSRRKHWSRRKFLGGLALTGSGALTGLTPALAIAEPPPETTKLRIPLHDAPCVGPQYFAEELLHLEGFTEVQYIKTASADFATSLTSTIDITLYHPAGLINAIDNGVPLVILGGVHVGCFELFGANRIRSIADLKGKIVAGGPIGSGRQLFFAIMLAYVGFNPRKDVTWTTDQPAVAMRLLADGKIDALLGFPPEPQQLRAKHIGHVMVNTMLDRPWSQYFCCNVAASREFVRKHPVATKRALRAILKAADICATDPQRVARFLVDKRYTERYDYALQAIRQIPYNKWREYDSEDTIRFFALHLREVGLIKSSPQKIIAQGTDWRFLNELKRELKA